MDLQPQKTPLYDKHVACEGKIVPFAGYLLPVQYKAGVIAEHMAVRTACGLFDVSHMGEVLFEGKDALDNIQQLTCNDFSGMADGQVRYSPMTNESGGVVDDVLVYRFGEEKYLMVVNASNRHKDVAWILAHQHGDVRIRDVSDYIAQIALQGPRAVAITRKLVQEADIPQKYYHFNPSANVGSVDCLLSRTGYTGETGFEFYCRNEDAARLFDLLMEAGKEEGLIPCGLGARDTLRMEAAMPLYGHEMDDDITPLETGLGYFVKLAKAGGFIGHDALVTKGEPTRARVGLKVTGRGIVREHCDVYADGALVGRTTSGTHCPFLGAPVAMALVDKPFDALGTALEADVRGRRVACEVVPLPFYKKAKGT